MRRRYDPASHRAAMWSICIWGVIAASVVLIPLIISPAGKDRFRLPKEVLFRAEGILLASIVALICVWNRPHFSVRQLRDPVILLPLLAVAWTLLTTVFSQNPQVSTASFLWCCVSAVIFLATYATGKSRGLGAVSLLLIPGAVNAASALFTALTIPFAPGRELSDRLRIAAFLGNPSGDVAPYLTIPGLAATALALTTRRHKALYFVAALLISAAIVATQTLSALIAYVVGLLALAFLWSPRWFVAAAALTITLTAPALLFYTPLRARLAQSASFFRSGHYNRLVSYRLESNLVAWEIFKDHPLLGAGPGTFGSNFFQYKLEVQKKHAKTLGAENPFRRVAVNFGEVHNDHLEILAETGTAGYALFALMLVYLGRLSFTAPKDHHGRDRARTAFARVTSFPFALMFALLAFAQFPLQLAAPTSAVLFLAALCVAWTRG